MSREGNNGENVRKAGRIGADPAFTWWRKALLVFILLLPALLVAGWLYSTCFVSPWEAREEKARVEAFLKEKYGKEFVAVKCEKQLVRLFLVFSLFTEVHLAEDPDISFTVGRGGDADMESEEMKEKYRTGDMYHEDYLQQVWSKQATIDMKGEIEKVYGQNVVYSIAVEIKTFDFTNQMFKRTPSYKEFLEIDRNLLYYGVRIVSFGADTQINESDLKKAYQMLKVTMLNVPEKGGLTIGYYLESDKSEILNILEGITAEEFIFKDINSPNDPYIKGMLAINSKDWGNVASEEDLKMYYKYWSTKKEEEKQ